MSIIHIPKLRLYLDTTIPNYLFADHYPERREITRLLMKAIGSKEYEAYISDVVIRELTAAPEPLLAKMMLEIKNIPRLQSVEDTEGLARAYLENRIFSANYIDDARHVSIASINNMDAVVSWNFGHLVNLERVKKVNIVNDIMGYKHIEIISPQEVIYAED